MLLPNILQKIKINYKSTKNACIQANLEIEIFFNNCIRYILKGMFRLKLLLRYLQTIFNIQKCEIVNKIFLLINSDLANILLRFSYFIEQK